MKLFVVVSYDIKEDKRRNRVLKIMKDYGQHVQYSVFECFIEKTAYLKMRARLEKQIQKEEDSIRFYFLCEQDRKKIERLGGVQPLSEELIVV